MARIVLCLLLLPAMLFGQIESAEKASGFRVEKQEIQKIEKPARAVEVKRGSNWKAFDTGLKTAKGERVMQAVIGAVPIHRDSAGVMVEYDLSDKAAKTLAKDAGKAARIGASTVEYDTTGRFRWEKEGSWFTLAPAFKTSSVGIKMRIEPGQVKTDYILDEKSPTRLAWGLKESWKGVAERKISPPVAWDATGKPVEVEQIFTSDSLIWSADTKGAVWPVTIDPTVIDTALPNPRSRLEYSRYGDAGITTLGGRDSIMSWHLYPSQWGGNEAIGIRSGNYHYRGIAEFTFSEGYPAVATIDSAFINISLGAFGGVTDTLMVAHGLWNTGTTINYRWGTFGGRVVGAAHNFDNAITMASAVVTVADSGKWKAFRLTTAAQDTVKHYMNLGAADTLGFVFMDRTDYDRNYVANGWIMTRALPTLSVYYVEALAPTVSAVADTVLPVIRFVGNIDTTGGTNATVRGVKYWLSGTSDTVTVADTGSFGGGPFVKSGRPALWNSTYLYKTFAENPVGMGESAIDSVRIDSLGTGGGAIRVDGRTVNTRR